LAAVTATVAPPVPEHPNLCLQFPGLFLVPQLGGSQLGDFLVESCVHFLLTHTLPALLFDTQPDGTGQYGIDLGDLPIVPFRIDRSGCCQPVQSCLSRGLALPNELPRPLDIYLRPSMSAPAERRVREDL
jgi:hypothetical protein